MAQHEKLPHALDQSCLFQLSNRRKLAKLLYSSPKGIEALAVVEKRYCSWDEEKKNGGTRRIDAPHENLKTVQKRIADILQRIIAPRYLNAPVKRRSYVSNAATHIGSRAFRLLDIEDFFPSCTSKRVYWFFHKRMKCAPDIAALLTKLTTLNGYLPQGSPCSPILAYFAYENMWDEINGITSSSGCVLSVYADDITISGEIIYGRDIWTIKQCLFRFGHHYNVQKERSTIDRPVEVTGVVVSRDALLLPNRQHKEIIRVRREISEAKHGREREHLKQQLRGRRAQESQITKHFVE